MKGRVRGLKLMADLGHGGKPSFAFEWFKLLKCADTTFRMLWLLKEG